MLHAPPFLRRVLDADAGWQERALQDAKWLWLSTTNASIGTESRDDAARRTIEALAQPGPRAKSLIRRALANSVLDERPRPARDRPPPLPVQLLPCPQCGTPCRGMRGLRLHAAKQHALRSPWSLFVHDNRCIACLKLFHCRNRVMGHVKNSPRCAKAIAEADVEPPSEQVVQALADQDCLNRKAVQSVSTIMPAMRRPCTQLQGPLPAWATA